MAFCFQKESQEQLLSIAEAAKILNLEGIGSTHLYGYLRDLNIIRPGFRIPFQEYLDLGYFKIGRGTKGYASKGLYLKTLVTQTGLDWLERFIFPKIRELEKKYLSASTY